MDELRQWPTLVTLLMFPVLVFMYVWLAHREEAEGSAQFDPAQLGRGASGKDFDGEEASRLEALARSLDAALEARFRISCSCRTGRGLSADAACCPPESAPSRGGTGS